MKQIVFIHDAWLTSQVWAPWRLHLQGKGIVSIAPSWPFLPETPETVRRTLPPQFVRLSLAQIVDHYEHEISHLTAPPLLIGHGVGGLVVQSLLDRGIGAAGVAICPFSATGGAMGLPRMLLHLTTVTNLGLFREGVDRMPFWRFKMAFGNGLAPTEQGRAFDRDIIPAPRRLLCQVSLGRSVGIDFNNPFRAPLLFVAAAQDRFVTPDKVRRIAARYQLSTTRTDFFIEPGRSHFLICEDNWRGLADRICSWLQQMQGE